MIDKDTQFTLDSIREAKVIWILKDEHGCVMLSSEDEDGVPVWATKADALAWATEDWSHCEPLSVEINTWKEKWTIGLTQDDLMIMISPSQMQEHGVVLTPQEFAEAL